MVDSWVRGGAGFGVDNVRGRQNKLAAGSRAREGRGFWGFDGFSGFNGFSGFSGFSRFGGLAILTVFEHIRYSIHKTSLGKLHTGV